MHCSSPAFGPPIQRKIYADAARLRRRYLTVKTGRGFEFIAAGPATSLVNWRFLSDPLVLLYQFVNLAIKMTFGPRSLFAQIDESEMTVPQFNNLQFVWL